MAEQEQPAAAALAAPSANAPEAQTAASEAARSLPEPLQPPPAESKTAAAAPPSSGDGSVIAGRVSAPKLGAAYGAAADANHDGRVTRSETATYQADHSQPSNSGPFAGESNGDASVPASSGQTLPRTLPRPAAGAETNNDSTPPSAGMAVVRPTPVRRPLGYDHPVHNYIRDVCMRGRTRPSAVGSQKRLVGRGPATSSAKRHRPVEDPVGMKTWRPSFANTDAPGPSPQQPAPPAAPAAARPGNRGGP